MLRHRGCGDHADRGLRLVEDLGPGGWASGLDANVRLGNAVGAGADCDRERVVRVHLGGKLQHGNPRQLSGVCGGSPASWTWNGSSYAGWLKPADAVYPGGAGTDYNTAPPVGSISDGAQVAYVNPGAALRQTLTTDLVSNAKYTLTFSVGHRADFAFPGTYAVQLLAGSTVLATVTNPVSPVAGSFLQASLTFTSLPVSAPHAGQPLAINILVGGAASSGLQANFDNFSLSAISNVAFVPEPGSLALLGTGVLILAVGVKRSGSRKHSASRL